MPNIFLNRKSCFLVTLCLTDVLEIVFFLHSFDYVDEILFICFFTGRKIHNSLLCVCPVEKYWIFPVSSV